MMNNKNIMALTKLYHIWQAAILNFAFFALTLHGALSIMGLTELSPTHQAIITYLPKVTQLASMSWKGK
jgi:uncharacterized membrane protein YesL